MQKQVNSILQWASLTLEEEVKDIASVQEVTFVKNLLWRVDPSYFSQWEKGKGKESLSQVLQQIGKYFKQEIGTDIQQYLDHLNVYKNPMDVWQLLLGIAIKGSNRGQNITLILDMDHAIQAELVGIVSGIIDKFGQNAVQSHIPEIEENKQEQTHEQSSQQQMVLALAEQNQKLNIYINQIEAQLQKQKQLKQTLTNQKKDAEYELQMFRNEKTAFMEILANANRTQSSIFDDGEVSALRSTSLSELANDISLLVRGLKKRSSEQHQKVIILQQSLREARREAVRVAEQNESYLSQLQNLNQYEVEIDQLRQQINQLFTQNSQLVDKLNELEGERINLIQKIQEKAQQTPLIQDVAEVNDKKGKEQQKKQNQKRSGDNIHSSMSSNGYQENRLSLATSEHSKHQITDQLRQPKLRTKLQRQIEHLKKTNQALKNQNISLKKSNQSLQQSTKEFVKNNKEVIDKWEQDYQQLVDKIQQVTRKPQSEPPQQVHSVEIQASQTQQPLSPIKSPQFESQQKQEIQIPPVENKIQKQTNSVEVEVDIALPQVKQSTSLKHKDALWQQIALKLQGIIKSFKQRQFSYQNTIHHLKTQNQRLITTQEQYSRPIRNSKISPTSSEFQVKIQPSRSQDKQRLFKIVRTDSQPKAAENHRMTYLSRMSYGSIKEGEDIQEEFMEKRIDTSQFYNTNSKLIEDISEKRIDPSEYDPNTDRNRRLYQSIYSNIETLQKDTPQANSQTQALQLKLKEQIELIQHQYQQLNKNYQQVFKKLQLYAQEFNQIYQSKQEHKQILQKMKTIEKEAHQNQQAQIVKLRLTNARLHQALAQAAAQKQHILLSLTQVIAQSTKQLKNESLQNIYRHILKNLEEIKLKYNQIMDSPMEFLSLKLEGGKEDSSQQFYQLFLKEKDKNKQLSQQIELLSSTLLQYRNIIEV